MSLSRVQMAIAVILMAAWVSVPEGVYAQLPADNGQVWKTYDISPFVAQAGPGSQKHVVDWVLQETGSPQWHGETVASLSADASVLRCFHTPEMQVRVEDLYSILMELPITRH